jgi:diacylglycerol kinase
MRKFFQGFKHAFDGVKYAFQTQINMRFHVLAAAITIISGLIFKLSIIEWGFITLAIALVLSAELFNTALEALTDLLTQEVHPLAKAAKDCAAGAVLITAIFATVVACLIFIPKLIG